MKLLKQPLFYLVIILMVGVVFSVVRAAFTEPTNSFPGSAPAAPLDTSSLTQIKEGALGLGGTPVGAKLYVFGPIEATGNVTANAFIGDGSQLTGVSYWSASSSNVYYDAGNVGIGMNDPAFRLDVGGCPVDETCLNVGGGAGKINAGTVDPLYTIDGERFATYLVGMTGVREETTGVVRLRSETARNDTRNGANYEYTIDFNNLEKGSDLWLFYQTTDFGENWDNLAVLLTPESKRAVWYEMNPSENSVLIGSDAPGRVSYRLSAPRFDHVSWSNFSKDSASGFILRSK